MSSYNYSIPVQYQSIHIDTATFFNDIYNEIVQIVKFSDRLDISTIALYFDQVLTPTEESDLNSFMTTYTFPELNTFQETIRINGYFTAKGARYKKIVNFYYPYTKKDTIDKIELNVYADGSTTSYDVQIIDLLNATKLLEQTLTNTVPDVISNITLTSQPTHNAVLEISVKGNNGNGTIHVNEIILYHKD